MTGGDYFAARWREVNGHPKTAQALVQERKAKSETVKTELAYARHRERHRELERAAEAASWSGPAAQEYLRSGEQLAALAQQTFVVAQQEEKAFYSARQAERRADRQDTLRRVGRRAVDVAAVGAGAIGGASQGAALGFAAPVPGGTIAGAAAGTFYGAKEAVDARRNVQKVREYEQRDLARAVLEETNSRGNSPEPTQD